MARRKDLGGLAALAGLAYMASRDKGGATPAMPTTSSTPSADTDAGGDFIEAGSGVAPENPDYGNESRREGYGVGKTATRATSRPPAPSRTSLGDDQYNPDVKMRSAPSASRVGRAGQASVSGESMADSIAREAIAKRKAREARGATPTRREPLPTAEDAAYMKKGGSVKGWGAARGARKAKIY